MNPQAFRFPKHLEHPSGVRLTLSPEHLLVEFRKAPRPATLHRNVQKLRLLPMRERQERRPERTRPAINDTSVRYWLKAPRTLRRGETLVRSIEGAAKRRVAWIAPVYSVGGRKDPSSLVSPLPHALLARIPDDLAPEARRQLLAELQALGLEEDAARSRYQRPYSYFVVRDPLEASAYQVKQRLARGKHRDLDVRFEMMPMVKPFTFVPNDALYPQQWNMARIRAGGPFPSGWDLVTGAPSVVVCILDSGCDLGHPDLRFAGDGINLGSMAGNGGPTGDHGTACAGIAAATLDNLIGVAGVAGGCRILPLAVHNFTDAEVAAGINYAADNGASVISMSFGEYGPNDGLSPSGWDFDVIDPAIEYAFARGVVLAAASGNDDSAVFNRYPARHPLVIAVGASDQLDNRKSPANSEDWGSNHGAGLSVVAPGVAIPTTDRRGADGYNTAAGAAGNYTLTFDGTSAATPHVAGLAALLKAVSPTLSARDIRDIIERTADRVGAVQYANVAGYPNGRRNDEMGYGRINVSEAVKEGMLYTLACLAQS